MRATSLPTGSQAPAEPATDSQGIRRWLDLDRIVAGARAIWPLLVILALAVSVRIYLMLIYHPTSGGFNDSIAYLAASRDHLFGDPFRPAGYPFFLRILRYVYPELSFVVVVQHLMGLAVAVTLYFCLRSLTGRRLIPALPAGLVALSGDVLLLEHSLLTETLYTFLVMLALCGIAYSSKAARPIVLLVGAGFLLGTAATVRSIAIPVILLAGVWLAFIAPGDWHRRLTTAAAATVPALAVFSFYVVSQGILTGFWGPSPAAGGLSMRASRLSRTAASSILLLVRSSFVRLDLSTRPPQPTRAQAPATTSTWRALVSNATAIRSSRA